MFLSVTVEKNQKKSSDVGVRMIRCESLYGLQANGTGSKLTYPLNYRDRKEKNSYLEITEAPATILAAMSAAYTSGTITVNVYPGNNTAITPVATIFDVTSVQWGIASGATDTMLYILEGGFEIKKVLVAHTIAQVVALA